MFEPGWLRKDAEKAAKRVIERDLNPSEFTVVLLYPDWTDVTSAEPDTLYCDRHIDTPLKAYVAHVRGDPKNVLKYARRQCRLALGNSVREVEIVHVLTFKGHCMIAGLPQ